MSDVAAPMTTATEPDGAPRVAGLDILRGIAILGILFMNINDMGGSLWLMVVGEESRYGWTAADKTAWFLREVFANGTARCMLEMLFGVGMVILTERAAGVAEQSAAVGRLRGTLSRIFGPSAVLKPYYWRNFVLFLFGLVHVFILLWPGDILHTYGLAAMVAFVFRRLRPRALLIIGLVLALSQLIGGGIGTVMHARMMAEGQRLEARQTAGQALTAAETNTLAAAKKSEAAQAKDKAEGLQRVRAEDHARRADTGTFRSWAWAQWDVFLTFESWGLEALFVWEAASTMLIGAALFKWGVIQGNRSPRFYAILMVSCYAVGLTLRAIGGLNNINGYEGASIAGPANEVARLATTLGHIGLVYVLLSTVSGARLLKPFEAAGRTALSIYIAQTLITLWVLYPPFMLGLYAQHSWAVWMTTALVINIGLLIGANVWVRHFRIAPVEWAWRSIIAGRALPMRKAARPLPGAAPLPA